MTSPPIYTFTKDTVQYPPQLYRTYDPPETLYIRGVLPQKKMVAIVGSRKHSHYGEHITRDLVQGLVHSHIPIVSGLAFGIDAIAHKETLGQGGTAVAVLGSGIDDDSVTPRRHLQLAREILASGGALISELPPGTPAAKYTFPRRNRIIAGLVDLIIVTEAREKSGALITAQYGLDNGIEVATLPHPITSNTGVGCNRLLQQGAHLITSVQDMYALLGIHQTSSQKELPLYKGKNEREEQLLSLLSHAPMHIDEITRQLERPAAEISSMLALLELQQVIQRVASMSYIRLR